MVALSLRGELPQGREASVALLGLAEARGDRPAMLNAMQAVGLISLLMGRVVEGREMAERTVMEFGASDEAERAAARAVGQDAGAAGLAVLSWALWLLGHMDSAVARIDTALQRAETVKDPHTQAYDMIRDATGCRYSQMPSFDSRSLQAIRGGLQRGTDRPPRRGSSMAFGTGENWRR
jgi:hypothetical protein